MPRTKTSLASNPIRMARESTGKTLEEFSDTIGVHIQALYLNESGVYPTVLPTIMKYLTGRLRIDRIDLEERYTAFQKYQRERFENRYAPWTLPEPLVGDSPVVEWRETLGLSRSALAKGICVQPSLLYRVERGKTPQLPDQLVEALRDIHFQSYLIEELRERLEEFYYQVS